MNVRTSTKRQNGKTYRYVQLVQSYWHNGMSRQRVLGNLGDLPNLTVDNIKLALKASHEGKAIVVAADCPGLSDESKVEANLRYLDLAIILDMWRDLSLGDLLEELLPSTESAARPSDVIAALTLQRCIAPGSKLKAQRWLPTTALPELLDLQPEKFNNTRLHRVLEDLFKATPAIQDRLPRLYEQHYSSPQALYIDATDTFFEGRGCEMAQRNRTKEGHRNKWVIGIVLLVNEQGYPLRWQVVPGKKKDHQSIGDIIDNIKEMPWILDMPFVCDRAMGKESSLSKMYENRLRFVTAAPVNTIETYTKALPHQSFTLLGLEGTDKAYEKDIKLAADTAREIGLKEVDEELFFTDLGVIKFKKDKKKKAKPKKSSKFKQKAKKKKVKVKVEGKKKKKKRSISIAELIQHARQFKSGLEQGQYKNQAHIARNTGTSRARITQILNLLKLAPDIQKRLLACPKTICISEHQIRNVLKEDHERQREMLRKVLECEGTCNDLSVDVEADNKDVDEEFVETCEKSSIELVVDNEDGDEKFLVTHNKFSTNSNNNNNYDDAINPESASIQPASSASKKPDKLRLVAYFNPKMFVDQRRRTQEHLDEINSYVIELNEELSRACRNREFDPTNRKIIRKLDKYSYADVFKVELKPIQVKTVKGGFVNSFRCELKFNAEVWERRRRYDGFVLLLCHPKIKKKGKEIALLYRSKDLIEKDFQTIKSVVKLRPIYSYTNPKVQAHVTICMLALLLERILEYNLRQANIALSTPACLEILSTCHLNRLKQRPANRSLYSVTEATTAQSEILRALDLEHLTDDVAVARNLNT